MALFLLHHDQVNASPITKITSWLKFYGKNLRLVCCATVCAKSEVMLSLLVGRQKKIQITSSYLQLGAKSFECNSGSIALDFCFCPILTYYFTILIRKLFPKDIPALWLLNTPQVFCFLKNTFCFVPFFNCFAIELMVIIT